MFCHQTGGPIAGWSYDRESYNCYFTVNQTRTRRFKGKKANILTVNPKSHHPVETSAIAGPEGVRLGASLAVFLLCF